MCANLDVPEFVTAFVISPTILQGNCSTCSANVLLICYMLLIMLKLDVFHTCISQVSLEQIQ